MLAATLICAVVATGSRPDWLQVPDPHSFVHGINLEAGQALHLFACADVLRADGSPDLDRIKALLK